MLQVRISTLRLGNVDVRLTWRGFYVVGAVGDDEAGILPAIVITLFVAFRCTLVNASGNV
jgi:hypothetical protein